MEKYKGLPNGWVEIQTSEVYDNISLNGIKLPQKEYLQEGELPVIDQGQDFIGGYYNDTSIKVDCELPVIIFGDHTKAIKFIDFDFIAGADGIKVLKPHAFLLPQLFYYFIKSFNLPDKGYARHFKYLQSEIIRIPPLAEQKRIVTELDTYFEWLSEAETALAQVPILLKQFRQKVLSMAVSGDLTRDWREGNTPSVSNAKMKEKGRLLIPNSWQWATLSKINEVVTDGDHLPPPRSETGIPFIVISNIKNDEIEFNDTRFVPNAYYDNLKEYRKPKKNDVLFSVVGSIGLTVLLEEDIKFCFQRHIGMLRPNSKMVEPKYLKTLMKSQLVYDQAISLAKGVAQLTVSLGSLRMIEVTLPPLKEQKEIVKRVEELFSIADEIETDYQKAQDQLKVLPQILLQKAFQGELTPQYASDESAEILLKRIKDEKDSILKNKKERSKQPRNL